MSTTLTSAKSTTKPTTKSNTLIPATTLAEIERLDQILTDSREVIRTAKPMTRAFATAAAMREIENAITPGMMKDILNLMDSPLGFKTDRKPGSKDREGKAIPPYHESTIKRCVIVALLAGAELAGNQFNIIAAQAYFTKEFMQKVVRTFSGLTRFEMEIGPPMRHGEKTACMEGSAKWVLNGEPMNVVCRNTESGDMRIVVNSHATSGPDQVRGLAESKLLRRVVAKLTGLNLDEENDAYALNPAIEGKLASPIQIEHEQEQVVEPESESVAVVIEAEEMIEVAEVGSDFPPSIDDAIEAFTSAAVEELKQQPNITELSKTIFRRINEAKSTNWPAEAIASVERTLEKARTARGVEIRNSRGNAMGKV